MLNLLLDTMTVTVTTIMITTVTMTVIMTVIMTVTLYVIANFSFWLFGPLAYGTVYSIDSVNIYILLSNSFLQLNMSQSMS
jgi:uncharacterized membrane protein YccF (DUF307 family)